MLRFHSFFLVFALALALPATTHAEELRDALELSLGLSYSDAEDTKVSTVGLRWSHSFNPRWGFELAASSDDLGDISSSTRFADLSLRYTFFRNDRWEVFGFGGAGYVTYDGLFFKLIHGGPAYQVTAENDDAITAHVGLAGRYSLGERFYLRPEIRYREHFDVENLLGLDDDSTEISLGFGWRF